MLLARTGIIASGKSGSYWVGYLADNRTAGSQSTIIRELTVDSSSNVIVAGSFKNASGGTNVFIAKYSKSGVLQWQRSLADGLAAASQSDIGYGVITDTSDNVYVGGYFKNASSGQNAFIAKYNSSGTIQWQRSLADSLAAGSQSDGIEKVAVDASGNVYLVGSFNNSSGGLNGFVVKYNSSGTLQWQRSLADSLTAASQYTQTIGIAVDSSGSVYVSGSFRNASNGTNAIIAKYNSSGTIQWQRSLADGVAAASQFTYCFGVALDSSANVYVSGHFRPTAGSGSGLNAFVAKYNSSGTIQWQRSLADSLATASQEDAGLDIAVDSSGSVYVSGYFRNASSGYNALIAKYDTSGTIQWQRSLADGSAANSQNTRAFSIAVGSQGDLFTAGYFKNSSAGFNAFVAYLPPDGTKTGTYAIDANHSLTYATSSLTADTSSLTDSAGSLTAAAASLTSATSSLTDAASSLTTVTLGI